MLNLKPEKPAAGSLEAAALSLAQEVSGNPDDWERRRKALFSMQEAVDEAGKTVPARGEKAVFTAEVWRYLREPLKNTLVRYYCLYHTFISSRATMLHHVEWRLWPDRLRNAW